MRDRGTFSLLHYLRDDRGAVSSGDCTSHSQVAGNRSFSTARLGEFSGDSLIIELGNEDVSISIPGAKLPRSSSQLV